jgi:hypothetical protein
MPVVVVVCVVVVVVCEVVVVVECDPPMAAPCDAPPLVAGFEGALAGAALGAGADGLVVPPAALTRLVAPSSPARINAAEPYLMALGRNCMVIVSSFLFRARASSGTSERSAALLNITDFSIRESDFHVGVCVDILCSHLRCLSRLTKSRRYLRLGLADGDCRRWRRVRRWGRRRYVCHWRRGCGGCGRLRWLSTLVSLSTLIATLIVRRRNRNDFGYGFHKIVRRRHRTFRESKFDFSVVMDLIS